MLTYLVFSAVVNIIILLRFLAHILDKQYEEL